MQSYCSSLTLCFYSLLLVIFITKFVFQPQSPSENYLSLLMVLQVTRGFIPTKNIVKFGKLYDKNKLKLFLIWFMDTVSIFMNRLICIYLYLV